MTDQSVYPRKPMGKAQMVFSLILCFSCTALIIWLRMVVYHDRVFPISSSLPLLLCLWNRHLGALYAMSIAFTIASLAKYMVAMPKGVFATDHESVMILSQFINIWVVTGVIHALLHAMSRLEKANMKLNDTNSELEGSNEELASSNEELASREEEITRQNEELQSQTEELERQAEELRQQAEEMEQQSAEIQEANAELTRKERGLQTLLESGRWLRGDMNEQVVMNGICHAAVQVLSDDVQASAIVRNHEGDYQFSGDFGFGLHGAVKKDICFSETFGALVIESQQTACIEDIAARPDIKLPRPGVGAPFRAIIAAPIWQDGQPVAALEMYSVSPRQWSEHEFRIIEWMAAQAALALQSVHSQQELDAKRRDAEAASIQKTRFLAAVSHDVRTPANAISLLAEFIERCANDPAKIHQIPSLAKNLWSNARSMVDLVSDVLDLTRFDSGRVELDVTEFSLNELLEAEVRQSEPFAHSKNLSLQLDSPEPEIRLSSDRTKLARVLSNLVSNAIKFTDAGDVSIHSTSNGDESLTIHIVDTGIGIPSEHLPYVFDEFFQIRNPERNRDKGAGLGLAICKRLLNGLGFTVNVKSLVGVGTTFSVNIPATYIATSTPQAWSLSENINPTGDNPLRGLKILLVEDHDVAREITCKLLAEEGATVDKASTGREGIQAITTGSHELVLLDLNLPDFDGTEILKSLQSGRPESLKWILVVTGDVRPERIEEVRILGADGLIPKPVSMEKIRDFILSTGTAPEEWKP